MTQKETDRARRLAAKRFNERLKLLIVALNAIAVASFGAAFILPMIGASGQKVSLLWIIAAFALHLVAQGIFHWLRSEE
jgi:hypothetical protein